MTGTYTNLIGRAKAFSVVIHTISDTAGDPLDVLNVFLLVLFHNKKSFPQIKVYLTYNILTLKFAIIRKKGGRRGFIRALRSTSFLFDK